MVWRTWKRNLFFSWDSRSHHLPQGFFHTSLCFFSWKNRKLRTLKIISSLTNPQLAGAGAIAVGTGYLLYHANNAAWEWTGIFTQRTKALVIFVLNRFAYPSYAPRSSLERLTVILWSVLPLLLRPDSLRRNWEVFVSLTRNSWPSSSHSKGQVVISAISKVVFLNAYTAILVYSGLSSFLLLDFIHLSSCS